MRNYRSYAIILLICINAAVSSFYFGYSMVYLATFPHFSFVMETYEVNFGSEHLTKSLVQGVVSIGCILGAILSWFVVQTISRRNGFILNIVFMVLAQCLIFVKSGWSLMVGRLVQGICGGVATTLVPLYINQMVPVECRNLGSLHHIFVTLAQTFCYFLFWVMNQFDVQPHTCWFYVSQFICAPLAIQMVVFLFVFPYETPKYLLRRNKAQAKQLMIKLYNDEYCSLLIQQSSEAIDASLISQQSHQQPETAVKTSRAAIFMGIHLSIFKQLTGLSVITVYGKETLLKIVPEISDVLPILIAFIPCISAIFVSLLLNRFGRKTLIRNGALVIMLCQVMIIIAFFVEDQAGSFSNLAISSSMIVFMISFGYSFGPVVFTYIPEIMEPKYIPSSTFANLTGMAFCIMVFPLIEGILPNDNPSPMFLFFFIWCFISLIINSKYMIETKDKSRAEVFRQYLKLKPCS